MIEGHCTNSWGAVNPPVGSGQCPGVGQGDEVPGSPRDLVMIQPTKWRRILKITQNLPCTCVLNFFRVMISGHLGKISILMLELDYTGLLSEQSNSGLIFIPE